MRIPAAPLNCLASIAFGTLTGEPPNPPRCQPCASPLFEGSMRSVQRLSCERPAGPSLTAGGCGGASAAASAEASATEAAAAASAVLLAVADTM